MLSNCIPFTIMGQEHCLHYLFNPCSEADIILTISWMRKLESQRVFGPFPKSYRSGGERSVKMYTSGLSEPIYPRLYQVIGMKFG